MELTKKDTLFEELERLEGKELIVELTSKIPAVKGMLDGIDSSIMELEREKNRLIELIKSHKQHKDFIRGSMQEIMVNNGVTNITISGLVAYTRDTESLEVLDVDFLPEEFIKVEKKPKKADIKKALKETGVLPAGCSIVKKTSLTITKERGEQNER